MLYRLLIAFTCIFSVASAQETIIHYLSGTDKDHTVQWDFMVTKGQNSGKWSTIPVPSNWEFQKFGTYNYYQDAVNPDEQGFYKYHFKTQPAWKNKKVEMVFEGSMTDTEVKINGKLAGPVHQGGFYQFKYDITDLLTDTDNLLEATVSKRSTNASINRAERKADFWLFGGIYRPVYLKIVPKTSIDRVAIDAKANGDFVMQVFSQNTVTNQTIEAQVQELNGKPVGKPFSVAANDSTYLKNHVAGTRNWNPEKPALYHVVVSIKEGAKVVHTIKQRFGFRTVEFRPRDGFYVNDVRVVFKGVCRHSQWPESGRALSRNIHLLDIGLIKEMNMNAVRMSHYPPDQEFLDLCDSLGLFVLDELTGWQAAYDTVIAHKLVKEMVPRDVNHPSIIIWDNGNEGGWNRAVDGDFHLYDPQKRFVMHPWEKFKGTDTKHYPDFNYVTNAGLYSDDVFYPTEFMHGLFDGGHGAGLNDFWNEMKKNPYNSGGFLWALHDEGAVRTDKGGIIDVAGNSAPDGIVGPHREKEGSFYTIKEIWSPVIVHTKSIPAKFDGRIEIENDYLYTNLNQCSFQWKLVKFPLANEAGTQSKTISKGIAKAPTLAPHEKGWLNLPKINTTRADALYLAAYDPAGKEIFTWSWSLHTADEIARQAVTIPAIAGVTTKDENNTLTISCDNISYFFDKTTGFITRVNNGKKEISFSGGPALAAVQQALTEFRQYRQGNTYIVEPVYKGDSRYVIKWTFESGKLPKLEYNYSIKGDVNFMGISFNYPEDKITGMKWLGRGPYRVWKNRMKGLQLGVWEKAYNNTITGESWQYPEFKGWHSELYWVKVQTKESDFVVYSESNNIFLQMLKPEKPQGATNENTSPPFAEGSIGFMHGISAIGTKFQPAEVMGPESQKNRQLNYEPIKGALRFDFR
ncbi:MAG: glycoside hydrolase family 2 [Segetibacter sp.]|nr:glycoside hydrolase family 2 [Segetibacter sp.]